ncbi:hypothetical protein [Halorubrum aquaticum]|uniref:hypothetical protein n=1 Tax=Halorubrum aquaticum TaxID=387340 RepID=UPI00122C4A78
MRFPVVVSGVRAATARRRSLELVEYPSWSAGDGPSLADVLLGFERGDEFVAVERRELDEVPKRVPDELAPTVEPAALPRVVYPFEERLSRRCP